MQVAQQPAEAARQQREVVHAFLAAARDGRFEEIVNGRPGVISWDEGGTPLSVLAFTGADGRIIEVTAVIDPAELALVDLPDPV